MKQQRRQPITHAEVEQVLKTGQFPLMSDAVLQGKKPYCHNCQFWKRSDDHKGVCSNIEARQHALFGGGELGTIVAYRTGELAHCPEYNPQ